MINEVGETSPAHKDKRLGRTPGSLVGNRDPHSGHQEARLSHTIADFVEIDAGLRVEDLIIRPEAHTACQCGCWRCA